MQDVLDLTHWQQLDLATPLGYKGESITDLLLKVARAEADFLNFTEASEHQRKHLQTIYQHAGTEAQRLSDELAKGTAGGTERGAASRRTHSTSATAMCQWLILFAALMMARVGMIRVLLAMSQNDALVDVREGIALLSGAIADIAIAEGKKMRAVKSTLSVAHSANDQTTSSPCSSIHSAAAGSSFHSASLHVSYPANSSLAPSHLSQTPTSSSVILHSALNAHAQAGEGERFRGYG